MREEICTTRRQGRTFDVARVRVEPHELDRLVVRPRGDQVTDGAPGEAVDAALVVFGSFEQDRRLVCNMVFPGIAINQEEQTSKFILPVLISS
jgi:hypothetical protein